MAFSQITPQDLESRHTPASAVLLRILAMSAYDNDYERLEWQTLRKLASGGWDDTPANFERQKTLDYIQEKLLMETGRAGFLFPIIERQDVFIRFMQILEKVRGAPIGDKPDSLARGGHPISYKTFCDLIAPGDPKKGYVKIDQTLQITTLERDPNTAFISYEESRETVHNIRQDGKRFDQWESSVRAEMKRYGFPYDDSFEDYIRYTSKTMQPMNVANKVSPAGVSEIRYEDIGGLLVPAT